MTGERASRGVCPVCGGRLASREATLPFILENDVVIVVKSVPAEVCADCGEAFASGTVTDQITAMLRQLKDLRSEVSVIAFPEWEPA